jgi:hypothetical protein
MEISNIREYKLFKQDLKKLLMQVDRDDLLHYQDDIKAYYCDDSVETKTITECHDVLVALYPTKKVYEHKYQTSSHFEDI